MTLEEAIKALKYINLKRVHPFYSWEEMAEVRNIAISALEKQIPKKPISLGEDIDRDVGQCPNCKEIIDTYEDYKYCSDCGQAIDWSEEE